MSAFSETGRFYGMSTDANTVLGGGYDPKTGAYMSFTYNDEIGGPYKRYTVRDDDNGDNKSVVMGVPVNGDGDSDDSDVPGRPSAPPFESETGDYTDDDEEEEEEKNEEENEERKRQEKETLSNVISRKMKQQTATKHACWISHQLDLLEQYKGVIEVALLYHSNPDKAQMSMFSFFFFLPIASTQRDIQVTACRGCV